MLVRLVKMTFDPNAVQSFKIIFETNKTAIRNFEGCQKLKLFQDKANPNIFFTYSYWKDEASLETYRSSDLFKTVWSQTKLLFMAKPEAWSVDTLFSLD